MNFLKKIEQLIDEFDFLDLLVYFFSNDKLILSTIHLFTFLFLVRKQLFQIVQNHQKDNFNLHFWLLSHAIFFFPAIEF